MCNASNCNHHGTQPNDMPDDLDDDLTDIFGLSPIGAEIARAERAPVDTTLADAQQYKMLTEEKCKACRGSGRFVSYTGRVVGNCFKCKGRGVIAYRTTLAEREAAAASRARKTARDTADRASQVEAWIAANPDDHAWIAAKAPRFEFAAAMAEALTKYGSLTEKQHATVTRLRLRDAERDAERKVEATTREASAPVVTVARIVEAFDAARANGIQRPKAYLGDYKFSLAPSSGRNAGALYVTGVANDAYLGKIVDGRFLRVRECTPEQEAEIVAVASDPKAAAIAFGRRTGRCSCCGRELTNHVSIDLGIGPICAEKYGW